MQILEVLQVLYIYKTKVWKCESLKRHVFIANFPYKLMINNLNVINNIEISYHLLGLFKLVIDFSQLSFQFAADFFQLLTCLTSNENS